MLDSEKHRRDSGRGERRNKLSFNPLKRLPCVNFYDPDQRFSFASQILKERKREKKKKWSFSSNVGVVPGCLSSAAAVVFMH